MISIAQIQIAVRMRQNIADQRFIDTSKTLTINTAVASSTLKCKQQNLKPLIAKVKIFVELRNGM